MMRTQSLNLLITEAMNYRRLTLLRITYLAYQEMSEALGNQHMVEQSVLMVWGMPGRKSCGLGEILVQPFIEGRTLHEMIWPFFNTERGPRLRQKYQVFARVLAPQLRHLLEGLGAYSYRIDFNPRNFICDNQGRLVYVDYQPSAEVDANNRECFRLML